MDLSGVWQKAKEFIMKYKYVLLVGVIGIGLLLIPGEMDENITISMGSESQESQQDIAEQLAEILSHIKGAGRVEVMLTVAKGQQIVYQEDETNSSGETGTGKTETVIITDGDRAQSGLVQQVLSPVYQGAIIVCQGADQPSVRLAIVQAVSNLTGLGADKISVVEMK